MRWATTSRAEKEGIVLGLLAGGRELYGLEMIRASRGSLKRHSIYTLLGRMEDERLIEGRDVHDPKASGLPRRLYKITELGKSRLADPQREGGSTP